MFSNLRGDKFSLEIFFARNTLFAGARNWQITKTLHEHSVCMGLNTVKMVFLA
jgi:hypothetical protein